MADACSNCGSVNTQHLADRYQCIDCGAHTSYDGKPADAGPSQDIKDAAQAKLDRGRQVAVVGNLADLQVAGGDAGPDTVAGAAAENRPGTTGPTALGEPAEETKKAKK